MPGLSQDERNDAYARMLAELGVGRIGTGGDAPPLPPDARPDDPRGNALPIEREVMGAQMYGFGEVWSRPMLDLRERSLVSVAALTAMRDDETLFEVLNIALNVGITPEELHEVFLHASVYAGYAAWRKGVRVANRVFVARGILEPGSGVEVEPYPPMTREERELARTRITQALGVGRVGLSADAPVLQRMPGGPGFGSRPFGNEQETSLMTADYGYGEVWGRPGLSLRLRSFVTMAMLQAMVENHQLHIHICNALNIGITRAEIGEVSLQVGLYHGNSGQHNAITVAQHVYDQHPAAGGGS